MRKHFWRIALILALLGVFTAHAAGWLNLPWLPQLESVLYDARIRAVAPGTSDDRIVVVDIDEKSLREKDRGGEGRWPWRRDRLARLVADLFEKYGVTLVATDIILSEKDASSGLEILDQLARHELKGVPEFAARLESLRPSLAFDHLLGKAMQGGPVVLGYAFHNDKPSANTHLPEGLSPDAWGLTRLRAQTYPGYAGLLPELQTQAAGAGHLNPLRDADGVIRRVPMLIEHAGRYYPALSLAVVQTLTGAPPLSVVSSAYGQGDYRVEKLAVGPIEIPVDGALNALVPFRGPARSFAYVSAVDVLQGRVPVEQLKNRIVLIGTSAAGLADLVATPVGASFPGVEVHANLITGMLDGRIAHAAAYAQGIELISVLFLGLLMMLAGIWLKPLHTMLVFGLAVAGTLALNMSLLIKQQLMLPLATPLACLVCVFVFQMTYGFFVESRGKRQMSRLFAHYVPPELVDKMAENPAAFSMAPMERELTVLFADVRNFTTISENLSPTELAELINVYLTAMSEVIRDGHHGTLDKYIGDAVMAFWGAPLPDERHAEDAVLAAIEMQRKAKDLNQAFMAKDWPTLKIGIGINSGPMRVGDMGSKIRRAYTVMGDAVNLGSRLEGLTKVYGVDVLIGENTRTQLAGWTCREVDRVRVKGKDQSVAIFEPLGRTQDLPVGVHEELAQWGQVLAAYHSADWAQAQRLLQTLLAAQPHIALYSVYAQRLADFQVQPPPPGWDGATRING
jgi:adenylate cyclase